MRITRYTDYSLRVLIFLALKHEELTTIAEVAQVYGISKNHLMKVVNGLANQGYIHSVRGKKGGLRLQQSPETINIGKLVRGIENEQELVECFGPENHCVITPACELKIALSKALEAFYCVLDSYTLEDLLRKGQKTEIIKILELGGLE